MVSESLEQRARDLLERMDIEGAQQMTAGDVVELAQLFNKVAQLERELAAAQAKVDALQAFKDYVHGRLDDAGIPVDPESPHKAAGCRIGGRLDVVLGMVAELATAQKDQQRYRWIRANKNAHIEFGSRIFMFLDPEKMDAAIDAAIAKEKAP